MSAKNKAEKDKKIEAETLFTKEQLVSAKKYVHQKDLLNILLENDKTYSFKETDCLIEEFLKKEVK